MSTTLASGQMSFLKGRHLVWFSCGAASAVLAKKAVDKYGHDCVVLNCDTKKDEHKDNYLFFLEVQDWIGKEIQELQGEYETIDDCFAATGYMSGVGGARCTRDLKKEPRLKMQWAEDTHHFGFTADESKRIKDFKFNNPDIILKWLLQEQEIEKKDCYHILMRNGIELPAMYLLGYKNNNCLGCVKATSPGYWSKVRRDFPKAFDARAKRSRALGCKLVRLHGERIFLDELPMKDYPYKGEDISCGPDCGGY